MKAEDFNTKTGDELTTQLLDLKKEQFNLRFQLSQGQLQNTARIRTVRRDIARINTFLNAKPGAAKSAPKKAKAAKAEKTEKTEKAEKAEKKPAAKKKTTGKKSAA